MKNEYKPYRGGAVRRRRGERKKPKDPTGTARRVAICAVILALAVGVRYAFPQLRETIGGSLFRETDFAAAFSSVGAALNGDVPFGEGMKAAFGYAFGSGRDENVTAVSSVDTGGQAAAVFAPDKSSSPLPENVTLEKQTLKNGAVRKPVEGTLLRGFGFVQEYGHETFHYGVDISAPEGTPVLAAAAGTVAVAGDSTLMGRYLILTDGTLETQYWHLSELSVVGGQTVEAGQELGKCGSTGSAEQSMLHFSMRQDGTWLDPMHYMTWQEPASD